MSRPAIIAPWKLRKEIILLYLSFKDRRTPLFARIPAFLAIAYLISPVDLIPDFIPFLGYIDDIMIVPLLINTSVRLLPAVVYAENLPRVSRHSVRLTAWLVGFGLLILVILASIFVLFGRLATSL